jgi:hypothetical protein
MGCNCYFKALTKLALTELALTKLALTKLALTKLEIEGSRIWLPYLTLNR